LSQSNGKKEVI
jgi:hypothetical protein